MRGNRKMGLCDEILVWLEADMIMRMDGIAAERKPLGLREQKVFFDCFGVDDV